MNPAIPTHPINITKDLSGLYSIVNPNDRILGINASRGSVLIILPQFLGYEQSMRLTIERTDRGKSPYKVKVSSDFFLFSIKKYHEAITVTWKQPFYQNGRWTIAGAGKVKKYNLRGEREVEYPERNKEIANIFLI